VAFNKSASPKIEEDVLGDLIELYLLGDVLDDVKLRNKTLRLLNTHICMGGSHLNSSLVNIIWDHTASNSMLRKRAVDTVVNGLSASDFAAEGASWPADFMLQVAIDFMDQHGEEHADYQGLKDRLEYYVEADDDA
jgi:hypothetical protein